MIAPSWLNRSLSGSLGLDNLEGNSVHVGGSSLGEGLSVVDQLSVGVLVLQLSDELSLLELNKAVSDALSGGEARVLSADTVSLLLGVVLSEGVDSNLSSHVELVSHGGSADVEPVGVIGGEVLGATGLVVGGPLRKLASEKHSFCDLPRAS